MRRAAPLLAALAVLLAAATAHADAPTAAHADAPPAAHADAPPAVAAPARAPDEGVRVHGDLTALATLAYPLHSGRVYGGGGGILGFDVGTSQLSFGVAARFQHLARIGDGWSAEELAIVATARFATSPTDDGWATFARTGLGAGFAQACFGGDVCGGGGFFASLELGANLRLGGPLSLDLGGELALQTGIGLGIDVLFLPSFVLALRV